MKVIFPTLILLLVISSCSINKSNHSTATDADNLIGEWVHSHEEDTDNASVFRMASYDFPPSRGREKITLLKDGDLVYTPIAPNDLPKSYLGNWEINNSELILDYDNKTKSYQIIEITHSILKLK